MIFTVDLEDKLEHPENKQYLVTTMTGMEQSIHEDWPIQVRATHYFDQYGIEIQVKSMLANGFLSWIVISRGQIRYVEEVYEETEGPTYSVLPNKRAGGKKSDRRRVWYFM